MIVKEADKSNVGKQKVSLDVEVSKDLDLNPGDVIQITHAKTNKSTAAFVNPEDFKDENFNTIRMDFFLRRNIEVKINDKVEITKIKCELAEKVVFAVYKSSFRIKNAQTLAKKLENWLITKEDVLSFHNNRYRIDLIVVEHLPQCEAVKIQKDTKISVEF